MIETTAQPEANITGRPDAAYIRKDIDIRDVARELGMEVRGNIARCFRPEAHQNGDRSPSLSFFQNRAKCHVCDNRSFSNIDLVQKLRGCSVAEAINWIAQQFEVPLVGPGRPRGSRHPKPPYRVGVFGSAVEPLTRSGVYGILSTPAARILPVFLDHRDERDFVCMDYVELAQKSGVKSDTSISKGLKELSHFHIVQVIRSKAEPGAAKKPPNIYKLTLDHPKLHQLMLDVSRSLPDTVAKERHEREQRRQSRSHAPKTVDSGQ